MYYSTLEHSDAQDNLMNMDGLDVVSVSLYTCNYFSFILVPQLISDDESGPHRTTVPSFPTNTTSEESERGKTYRDQVLFKFLSIPQLDFFYSAIV